MGLFQLFKAGRNTVIIDGVSLNESLGMKGQVSPRNQLQTLRRLANFVKREKLNAIIILSGTPLHKAPANKKFEGVTVRYSKSAEKHAGHVAQAARAAGAGAVLITGNTDVEKRAGKSITLMRVATFRKAFDAGGSNDSDHSDRGGGGRSRGGRSSKNRRPPKKIVDKENSKPANKSSSSDSDAINELIDLID